MSAFDYLARVVTIRPLGPWPGPRAARPKRSPFDSSWRTTVALLAKEVDHLREGAERAVLELDVTESQLRNDGLPYANARIGDHGVVLTIPSKHGQLRYPCDTFNAGRTLAPWQHNVRAIALALEALRKVDRYGVTSRGEQYAGWKQLPGAGESGGRDPLLTLQEWAERDDPTNGARSMTAATAYRAARRAAHPDRDGGSHDAFLEVQSAAKKLGVA